MKIKVTAITSFSHGALNTHVGQEFELTRPEAAELQAVGLIAIVTGPPAELDREAADNRPDEGAKMSDAPENKMIDAPTNKSSKAKAK
ncbi:hypothetical protein [Massilia violaceinigra]|nr:hypothetical protein [Massilia violaceinigra]